MLPRLYAPVVPLYDFQCRACGERFEARVVESEQPACPACGAAEPERLLSPFAGPFTIGVRGAAARRSDATRQAREQQRQERIAERREKREQA